MRCPGKTASATDLFEIIRTTRSMRRLKPDPVPERTDPKNPGGGRLCAEWRQHAAVAVSHDQDATIKETVGAYYKRAWDEQVAVSIW
jgi:hypothetical protein